MTGLSKSRILAHRQCPKRLWLQVSQPELVEEDRQATQRFAIGKQIGDLARTFYPNGRLIDTDNLTQAIADTANLLREKRRPLFEATFQAGGVLVSADLLLPGRGGYRMVEVKSSTCVEDYQLEDAAVQAWVARKAGMPVTRVEIAYVDKTFVYPGGGEYRGLLAHQNITAEVDEHARRVPRWIKAAQNTLAGDEPDILPGKQCKDPFPCPFADYCSPPQKGYPPETLPNIRQAQASALRAEGYTDIRKIPKARITNPNHLRVWRVTKRGQAELDPKAGEHLRQFGYPRYCLDFETINPAIPVWQGTKPYAHVPFQWSCHIERKGGRMVQKAFLADGREDPRRALAESLVEVLKSRGPIFAYYASFERKCIKELAAVFPDLAPALVAIIERIVDLHPIARAHYYHRAMRGSWSLKAVLPTIAPELAYDNLSLQDGGMAQDAFAEILDPEITPKRRKELRQELLDYCARDTWALVRMVRYFEGR